MLVVFGARPDAAGQQLTHRSFDQLFAGDDPGEIFTFNLPFDSLAPSMVRFTGYFTNQAIDETGVRFAVAWWRPDGSGGSSPEEGFVRLPSYDQLPIRFEQLIDFTPSALQLEVEGGGPADYFRLIGDFTIQQVGASLVRTGSVWKYLPVTNDFGTSWRAPNYDDGLWSSGPAQLGYGDQDEATRVPFYTGPLGLKNITTYFRRAFVITNAARYTNLIVHLLRDDGGVVYLNGVEVFRSNLPEGPIEWDTTAIYSVSAPEENNVFFPTNVPASLLVEGLNVLAVEIHQQNGGSQDISFDLGLVGIIDTDFPRLKIAVAGTDVWISWPSRAVGFSLYATPRLEAPVAWERVQTPVSDDGAWTSVRLGPQAAKGFFRLSNE